MEVITTYAPNSGKSVADRLPSSPLEDFSELLDVYDIPYKYIDYHLQVGEIDPVQGWILHISLVRSHIDKAARVIIPILQAADIPFKIVRDRKTARTILDGSLGHSMIGKIISIYPQNDAIARSIVSQLMKSTTPFSGPAILTDVHLGGILYTRYGSFNPVVKNDPSGKEARYIYDHSGNLIKDQYNIPFRMPEGIEWPFDQSAECTILPAKDILNGKYRIMSVMKTDAKGNVFKALYVKKPFFLRYCVIKQAKRHMWSDEMGRDITDRLKWQFAIHAELGPIVAMPKTIDFFQSDNDTYLAIEFIQGKSLYDVVREVNRQCQIWYDLPYKQQARLLGYIRQMIGIVDGLHSKGYVHRDITPVNFLVDKKDKIVIIDNELSYRVIPGDKSQPFEGGTKGFMSPEQENMQIPTFKEDIYSLGATIIFILTGLPPSLFSNLEQDILKEKINFFLQDAPFATIIASCLSSEPDKRPATAKMIESLHTFEKSIKSGPIDYSKSKSSRLLDDSSQLFLNAAIKGLVNEPMLILRNLWRSKTSSKDSLSIKEITEYGKSGGLYEGITGVLYFLGRAKRAGYDCEPCMTAYRAGWAYLQADFLQNISQVEPGLYGGAAGIALALKEGMDGKLLENSDHNRLLLQNCLELETMNLDVASGVAGQGIVVLQCSKYLSAAIATDLLNKYKNYLIDSADDKGWVFIQDGSQKTEAVSFSAGNTGILWFLLAFQEKYPDEKVKILCKSLLSNLNKWVPFFIKYLKKEGFDKACSSMALNDGIQGMAMVLIKAYELFQYPNYKKLAEDLLAAYPPRLVHYNYAQIMGLAGLGEVYLSAFKAFHNPEWQNRANHIANVFIQTSLEGGKGSKYWLLNNEAFPTADFMVGNSGILHFLIRHHQPDALGYRLLQ